MKSIRRTLLFSFLLLALAVLGGLSWYVYRVTESTLRDRDADTAELLKARHETRIQAAKERFDEELLRRAFKVASRSQTETGGKTRDLWILSTTLLTGLRPETNAVGLLMATPGLSAFGATPVGLLARNPRVHVADELMPRETDGHELELCLLYNQYLSPVQFSTTVGQMTLPPLDAAACAKLPLYDWLFEEFTVGNQRLRRVVYKAVVPGGVFFPRTPTRATRPNRTNLSPPPPRDPPPTISFSNPTIYVQYLRDTDRRDQELAKYSTDLEADLAESRTRTTEQLAALRWRLGLVLTTAVLAVLVGGAYLAHRGLAPLQKLTEAVSQVSEKDFQLKVQPADMPEELAPIVAKLQHSLSSLEKAFAYEKQAVADISHELRTPIASLVTTIQVCLRKPRGSEEYRIALTQCAEIGTHLQELVNHLMTLARLDAGADPVQPELLDLADLGKSCLDLIRPLAEEQGLTVAGHLRPGVLVESDPNKLREVLTNLLANAVQYNQPGGKIDLRVATAEGKALIEVRDTGIGIDSKAMNHLFERFFRADASRHADKTHAGLGLAIVKGFVDLLGGTIQVESQPGQGSSFRVRLPLAADPGQERLAS